MEGLADLALSMQHDSVLLNDVSLPVIKRLSKGIKHTVDADNDIILGYSTDSPVASVDINLGQVRLPTSVPLLTCVCVSPAISEEYHICHAFRCAARGGWPVRGISSGG